jgi:hypothetical protein
MAMTRGFAAIALLATGAASAQRPAAQQVFCAELKRVVAVAEEGEDFTYLERSRAAPPSLGFADGCRATGDGKTQYWVCGQSFAPDALGLDALAVRISDCLPDAVRGQASPAREAVFTLPYARIHVSELGGPGAHVGRIVELSVAAPRP